jgi:hypothetical protein
MISSDYNSEPVRYGASFSSSSNMAANTPVTIFSAGSNVNGAILHCASAYTNNAAAASFAVLARSTLPTGVADGDSIDVSGGAVLTASIKRQFFIPPGKGVYMIQNQNSAAAVLGALFTLL